MRQLIRQRQPCVEAGLSLLRVPEQPEGHGGIGLAGNTRILAHAEDRRTALVWSVTCDAFFKVMAGGRQHTKAELRKPKSIVGNDCERLIVGTLRQAQQRFPKLQGKRI